MALGAPLVFLIFLSGFLLPIERMSPFAAFFARTLSSNIALQAFNKVVFYNQGFGSMVTEFIALVTWFVNLAVLVVFVKKVRNV